MRTIQRYEQDDSALASKGVAYAAFRFCGREAARRISVEQRRAVSRRASRAGSARVEFLAHARRLAVSCRCCASDISRRIARKTSRSPLTILHTIRKHDQDYPERAIFARITENIEGDERCRILRGYRRGMSIKALARR